ncbi:MAG: hypothetical protein KGI26_03915 [Thaumarchaeota archaeon]|nr:hypothetical protein [Nitrososphaerota archaeon]
MARLPVSSETFLWAVGLASIYAVLSFLWSALGFLSPVPPIHLHEYAFPALVTEVGGHVLFGLLAALPTMDMGLVLLAGGESVLIDSDHLLAALGYPVEGRLAHSAFFALFAALALAYLARRSGRRGRGVFFVTLSSVAAHLSYDVFAGNGFFYIAAPLSFASYEFPLWTWLPLLLIGVALGSLGRLRARRRVSGAPTSDKPAPPAGRNILTPVK